jgi:hypothetical protein
MGQVSPFVTVHAREAGSILDQGQHGSISLDQEDIAHVAQILQRRPDCGIGSPPQDGVIDTTDPV